MDAQSHVDIRTEGCTDRPVLVVAGELDPFTATTFDRALQSVDPAAGGRVVVDLAGVEFIDSAGLRRLLTAQRRFGERGVDFVIRSPSAIVRRLLEITALDSLLTIEL